MVHLLHRYGVDAPYNSIESNPYGLYIIEANAALL